LSTGASDGSGAPSTATGKTAWTVPVPDTRVKKRNKPRKTFFTTTPDRNDVLLTTVTDRRFASTGKDYVNEYKA
jgi:hypothetical protein